MNKIKRRTAITHIALLAASIARPSLAADTPIRLTVGFPPGGTTDVIARLVATNLSAQMARSIIVENRPGASGNIAAGTVAKGPADGSTLLLVPSSHATNATLYKKLNFDTEKDFSAIGMVATTPYVLVVHPSVPARSVSELIRLAKAEPGRLQYGTASPGTGQHLAAELFKSLAKVEMTQIPYKGSSAALPDLLAGRVPLMFDNVAVMTPHVRSQAVRALAVTGSKRSALLADLPTIADTLPGYEIEGWFALMASSRTPEALVKELNQALNQIVNEVSFVRRLNELGAEPVTTTPGKADEFVRKEVARWGEVIRSANISLD
jgi:tripartite-type tricarboxylate transporter receptor subunit TctC